METDSPNYTWLNRIDFIAPGTFNGTEVMTVNHYFPNVSSQGEAEWIELTHSLLKGHDLPNGLPNATIH